MGRIDTNATQESHQTPAETIDDAPPHEEDLYEPPTPPDYQPHQPAAVTPPTPPPRPQAFPPPQDHPHHIYSFPPTPHQSAEATPPPPQAFPPPQDHPHTVHSFPPTPHQYHFTPPLQPQSYELQPFPPPQQDDKPPAQFPPPQEHTPEAFPPNIPTANQIYIGQQQNPSVGMQFIPQQAFPQQPVGGIPVGVSPSPLITQQNQLRTQPWRTHLFDCMKNPKNAIITLFFPCVTFGQIAEIVDSGSTSCGTSGMLYSLIACCIAMPCIMSCTYRTKLRSKFGLVESPAPDWIIHCCCEYCALCQEYRELQERGYDPSIGYLGNLAKQQQKLQQFGMMTPPMQQRMM